ncbi:spore-associated protein A [Kitasatospora sp. NPDC088346]|uniref:spore-associated protein A n=1 Tax=Kitasatospora sp. NPDC088346 TaxID=3364073 RepID=UPI0038036CB9
MKRSIKQTLARVGVAVVATAGAVVAVPSVAQAADYNGACGSGYRVVDSMSLKGGTAFLTYNSSTGQNCAVTVRDSPGSPVYVLASISLATGGNPWYKDGDYYGSYAGPVYVHAPGQCIDWIAQIEWDSAQQLDSHCG